MFARIVVIQLPNQKCITYIWRTIIPIVLHLWSSMISDISNSLTQISQVCFYRLTEKNNVSDVYHCKHYKHIFYHQTLLSPSLSLSLSFSYYYYTTWMYDYIWTETYGIELLQYFILWITKTYKRLSIITYELTGIRNKN